MAVRPDKNIYQRLGMGDPGARPKDNTSLRFSEAKKFPQDENGFYIPQEYWDEFGYVK